MNLKTTFEDAHNPEVPTEERQWSAHGETVEYPSSRVIFIDCPFCKAEVRAYVWSLAGGGKRCECGAIFSAYGSAYRKVDPDNPPKPVLVFMGTATSDARCLQRPDTYDPHGHTHLTYCNQRWHPAIMSAGRNRIDDPNLCERCRAAWKAEHV